MPRSVRLLLVDDHSVFRMGLAAILGLQSDFSVVAEADDGAEAIEKYRALLPDVVLMDVRMPGLGGLESLRQIRSEWPSARVLMLTTSELDVDIQRAMEAGACGYLLKNVRREELCRAITLVLAGGRYMPAAIERRLAEISQRKQLSEREIEVLDGLRRGLSNRDIGLALSISEFTAKAHVKAIMEKLESADRTEAVARGFEQGLLRIDGR